MAPATSILHVEQPTSGGVRSFVLDLARAQAEAGSRVGVAAPELSHAGDGVDTLAWEATRVPGPSVVNEVRRLKGLIDRWEPDVVHLHSSKAGLCGRLALRGRLPTIFQPHAWSFEALTGPMRAVAAGWERTAARWTDVIVCVSEGERRAASGNRSDIRVVPNGVDLGRWVRPEDPDRGLERGRLGIGKEPLAVCVGRLSHQKGQDILIAAWPSVRVSISDATLVLVGDGPDRAQAEGVAGPGVRFIGEVADTRPWMIASDIVVAPSRWEGMSLAVLEAMACGRSVVATNVNGAEETVGRGAGTVIARNDADLLSAAIVERLKDPAMAQREGAIGRALIEKHHDWRRVVDSFEAIYADAMKRD